MLPRHHRLTRPEDFRAVFRRDADLRTRRRAGTPLLVVHAAFPAVGAPSGRSVPTPVRPPRVGFVVSRAVGNSVVRHRVVRRLRALMAVRVPALPAGGDVVVRAQPAAAGARSTDLGRALDDALGKALGTDRTLAGAGS